MVFTSYQILFHWPFLIRWSEAEQVIIGLLCREENWGLEGLHDLFKVLTFTFSVRSSLAECQEGGVPSACREPLPNQHSTLISTQKILPGPHSESRSVHPGLSPFRAQFVCPVALRPTAPSWMAGSTAHKDIGALSWRTKCVSVEIEMGYSGSENHQVHWVELACRA